MWKRGGQSSALNRAQAMLVAKKNSRGDAHSTQRCPAKTQGTDDGFINTRPTPPNTNSLFSGLNDLSSSSSAPEHEANPTNYTASKKKQARLDIVPQSSVVGGGSRFLKKASPPVTNSSQSPVSVYHMQQMSEPRYVSSSHHGSQAAVLSRLAQIESRIHSRLQPQEQTRKVLQPATPHKTVTKTLEASTLLSSAQSSNDQSHKVQRFLKNKVTTSESSLGPGASIRTRSRAAAVSTVPFGGVETKSVKVDYGVSLESDEEDMRKLLGDLLDSTDNSFLRPDKSLSVTKTEKMLSQKAQSTPPSPAVQHLSSNTVALCCPSSPSNRSSPFRFTGQAQAHFSPSAVSPSPSPPCVSPSLSKRLNTSHSSQHSICSVSGHNEVLSLEELFPVQPASEDIHDVMSSVSSKDFKLNVMTLDELVPSPSGYTEKMPRKQRNKHNLSVSGTPVRHEKIYRKAEQQHHKEEEEEDMLDYQSDFESESQGEQNYSASKVSEQLMGNGDEEAALKVRDEASVSDLLCGRTEDDYSDIFPDPSRSRMSETSDYSDTSESLSRSRDSRSPMSHTNQTSSHQSDRHPAARKVVKEAAVQTQPATCTWPTDMSTRVPVLGLTYQYMNPMSVAAHSLEADIVQAVSTYNPNVLVLNELLKHQLATTRQFIENSRHLHTSLVRSLEPPDYSYTTLEETKEYICIHRPSKLTMEEALKEVMQEMKEYQCTIYD